MNLMISNMSWYVCLFPRCIFRCFWEAEHSMELFFINLHVIMLPDSLYSRIGWVEFKETHSLLSFSEPIFPVAWHSENFFSWRDLSRPWFYRAGEWGPETWSNLFKSECLNLKSVWSLVTQRSWWLNVVIDAISKRLGLTQPTRFS